MSVRTPSSHFSSPRAAAASGGGGTLRFGFRLASCRFPEPFPNRSVGRRLVDSKGVIYTLDAFKIKGGEKREVMVPACVHDIAKVQVYCAWAQVLLGEASFSQAVE